MLTSVGVVLLRIPELTAAQATQSLVLLQQTRHLQSKSIAVRGTQLGVTGAIGAAVVVPVQAGVAGVPAEAGAAATSTGGASVPHVDGSAHVLGDHMLTPAEEPKYFDDPIAKFGGNKPVAIDSKFMYNRALGDTIPIDRGLPEVRPEGCQARLKKMDISKFPTTSVVIVDHNEAASTLQRTVASVLNRSPPHLLKEIIIVDDCSEWDQAKQVEGMPKTRVLRNEERQGLMLARMRGFAAATAETVTFLDSHIECQPDWLPPLLERVALNETTVVSPVIDIIKEDTFAYVPAGGLMRGIFDWQLTFKWKPDVGQKPQHLPFLSPTHAGGLFTISKKFFEHLGLYDKGMHVWGYENIELSFRVWMCGGRLEIDPCSRVGHIFRSKSPLKFTGENYQVRNKLRTAAVWTDDYFKRIAGAHPDDFGDISEQLALRKRLKCHNFQWYLDNVFPDHPVLSHITTLQHVDKQLCLDTMGNANVGAEVGLYACHEPEGNQRFEIDASESGSSKITNGDNCLVPSEKLDKLIVGDCESAMARWITNGNGELRESRSSRCLQIVGGTPSLAMVECQKQETPQWLWKCEGDAKNQLAKGLKETSSGMCVDAMARPSGQPAGVWGCHGAGGNQAFGFRPWEHAPTHDDKASSMAAGAEAGILMNSDQDLCLKATMQSSQVPRGGLKTVAKVHKVLLEHCHNCDGGELSTSSDCVWWRVGNQLRSRETTECLKLGKAQDAADLEAGSCDDEAPKSWDTSIASFGLCAGDGS